ncbi:MAG: winged helix-turn-helix domain-containing protein [Myxococcota bacterium]|nr:winged helix-turn-helix domain-containing protein [Myxococcota bacterium]
MLDEAHWFYLVLYLHLNAVRARLVLHPDQYIWTSHSSYVDDKYCPSWLTTSEMKAYFDTEKGYLACLDAAMNGSVPAPPDFDSVICGAGQNARHMVCKQPEVTPGLSSEEVLREVEEVTGASLEEILTTRRGAAGNPARALAIWWLIHGAGQTNAQLGERLDISPSAVSRILKKYRDAPSKYLVGKIDRWQNKFPDKDQWEGSDPQVSSLWVVKSIIS